MSDLAWHETAECRQLIERTELAMAEYKARREECLEHDIRLNNWRHGEALKLLEQCIRYVRDNNYYAFVALDHRYCRLEHTRLSEKLTIMMLYKIKELPSPHSEREKALRKELREALEARIAKAQEVAA